MKSRVARHHVREEKYIAASSPAKASPERDSASKVWPKSSVSPRAPSENRCSNSSGCGLVESVDHLGVFVGDPRMPVGSARPIRFGSVWRVWRHDWHADMLAAPTSQNCGRWQKEFLNSHTKTRQKRWDPLIAASIATSSNYPAMPFCCASPKRIEILGMTVRASREPQIIYEEHLQIIEAIEHNTADEAERIARQHVAQARKMIETRARQGTFVPNWVG